MIQLRTFTLSLLSLAAVLSPFVSTASAGDISSKFQNPPMEVRPSGYWWWLYNNVDNPHLNPHPASG